MRDYFADRLRFLQRATAPLEMPRRPAASRFLKNFPAITNRVAKLHTHGIRDGSEEDDADKCGARGVGKRG
jgi:hypothetical protein